MTLVVFACISLTITQHENTNLQLCLSTRLHWVLYYYASFTYFFRLDFSVVELLDIFTPVSAPKLSKPSTRRPETSQHRLALKAPKPVGGTLFSPARSYLQHTQQDQEESQILEDIFFIC